MFIKDLVFFVWSASYKREYAVLITTKNDVTSISVTGIKKSVVLVKNEDIVTIYKTNATPEKIEASKINDDVLYGIALNLIVKNDFKKDFKCEEKDICFDIIASFDTYTTF